jgi:hypothetical protein
MLWPVNPRGGKTTDWRAGCGRTARPVRREGEWLIPLSLPPIKARLRRAKADPRVVPLHFPFSGSALRLRPLTKRGKHHLRERRAGIDGVRIGNPRSPTPRVVQSQKSMARDVVRKTSARFAQNEHLDTARGSGVAFRHKEPKGSDRQSLARLFWRIPSLLQERG